MVKNSVDQLNLKVGDTFKSSYELDETVEKYSKLKHQSWVKGKTTLIRGSRHAGIPNENQLKYLYITYHCVFFGKARTQATERETSTVKKKCTAFIKAKLNLETKDRLEIYDIDFDHKNHDNSEAFIHLLPHNKRLSPQTKAEVEKTLLLGGNAKMIKKDLAVNKQKILLNKDLANIKAQAKKPVKIPNDLKTFCDLLRTEYGYTMDTLCDDNLVFKVLYFSNKQMQDSMSAWSEIVLVDGTYKFTNRNLTVLIFLVQNGIGRGEVVGSFKGYLTHHAFINVQKQFKLLEVQTLQIQDKKEKICIINTKHGIITSTPTGCSCQFRNSYDLPCKHIFAVRKLFEMSLYEPSLCAERWTKNYTLKNHRLKVPSTSGLASAQPLASAGPSIEMTPRRKKPTTSHKRKIFNAKGSSLADFLFNSCDLRFENRCATIDELFEAWGIEDEVKILRVKAGEVSDHSLMRNPETKQVHTPQRTLTEDDLMLPATRRLFGKPSGSGKTTTGFFPRRQNPGS